MNIIKNIREEFGYTQAELAKKSGLSLRTIQRLESNNKEPKGHTLIALSKVFNIEPKLLQEKFIYFGKTKKSEKTTIQLINLSIISFVGIPFGNLIFPFILWLRNRKSKLVDEVGRRIINFQILWWIVIAVVLSISPFISRKILADTQIIFYVLFLGYALNIIIVCITAIKLKHNNYKFPNLQIRFL